MSTAENISPFKEPSPTFRVQSAIKAEVDEEVELIEACTPDPEAGTLPNGSNTKSRALRRAFLAQSPACNTPKTSDEIEMQQLLVDATAFLGKEGGQIVASNVASFKKEMPHVSLVSKDSEQIAPGVVPQDPPPKKKPGNLFEYLMALMMYQISVSKDQANISQMGQTFAGVAVKAIQEAGAKASKAIDEYEAAERSRKGVSFWLTFASIALTVIGAALCAIGAGAFILAVGVSSLCLNTISAGNGQTLGQAMDKALLDAATQIIGVFGNETPPDWVVELVKDTLMLVVVLVATAAIMGGISLIGQAVSSVGSKSAAQAGTQAAAQVATEAAAQAATGSAARTGVKVATEQVTKSLLQRYIGNALLLGSASPLVPSVSMKIAKVAFPNDETAQMIMSTCLQFIIGLAGSLVGGSMSGSANGNTVAKVISEEGRRKIVSGLKTFQTLLSAGASYCQVETGLIFQEQATIFEKQGEARFAMTLSKSIIDSLHTSYTSMNEAFRAAHQVFANISECVENFLTPYSVQSMGYK